jgi:hypothetical protein
MILPVSASQVARISGISHQGLAVVSHEQQLKFMVGSYTHSYFFCLVPETRFLLRKIIRLAV